MNTYKKLFILLASIVVLNGVSFAIPTEFQLLDAVLTPSQKSNVMKLYDEFELKRDALIAQKKLEISNLDSKARPAATAKALSDLKDLEISYRNKIDAAAGHPLEALNDPIKRAQIEAVYAAYQKDLADLRAQTLAGGNSANIDNHQKIVDITTRRINEVRAILASKSN